MKGKRGLSKPLKVVSWFSFCLLFRVYPYLCRALKTFVKDRKEIPLAKDFYVAFQDLPTRHKIRELTSSRIGLLTRISGQVVRTHPVHPELVSGTFLCLDCQTVIKDVEQQFKYTQPNICQNPVCANRRRFLLDTNKSRFVDFQKVFYLDQIQPMLIIHF